jgi:threonine dehydrogenase-like Zn-dependent dehydrogenase
VLEIVGIGVGETVVVQGSGPVGIAAAMYAQLAGAARTIVVGGPASRLDLARSIGVGDVHIDIFASPDPDERRRQVLAETPGGRGADVVLECAGVPSAVPEGFEMVRRNGRYLVLGQYTDRGPTPINPHVITRKQLKVYGSWAFAEAHYARYVDLLPQLAARFDLTRLVTRYPLAEVNRALADMASGSVMKAVLAPGAASTG